MNLKEIKKIFPLFILTAFTCFGSIFFGQNSDSHYVTSNIQNENYKLSKPNLSNQDLKFIEFDEDTLDEDDEDEKSHSSSNCYLNAFSNKFLSKLKKTSSSKSGSSSTPLFILFCSLKIPYII